MPTTSTDAPTDRDSTELLSSLTRLEALKASRVPAVKTVLVILSSAGMVFDVHSLRHEILLAYPDSAVFFRTTDGKPIGAAAPRSVDLLVDFTGPGQRQPLFYSRKLRRMARVAIGRDAGLFRRRIYDRVYDERKATGLPDEMLARERAIQRGVLALAGIALVPSGTPGPDRGKSIALELPPMQKA